MNGGHAGHDSDDGSDEYGSSGSEYDSDSESDQHHNKKGQAYQEEVKHEH